MKRNFKLIGGFGIAEKEIQKRKTSINEIIDKYFGVGIREFFVGYNPAYRYNKFGFEFSPNGRFGENEQITSYDTLKSAIDYIHSLKDENGNICEIFLAVNAWYYSEITMPLAKQIVNEGISAGIDGFIVSNFEILEYLAEIEFKGKINISTIMCVYNEDSVEFLIEYFQNLGLNLNRMILPRELTLNEIKKQTSKFPNIKFEVFGHGDYCRYSNGYCMAEHKYVSRDLCTFVLKHGLDIKKSIKYNFKDIILSTNLIDQQKQTEIDNEINDLEDIFVSQNIVNSNFKNTLIQKYIKLFANNFFGEKNAVEIKDIAQKIYALIKKDLKLNPFKYIYDGLRSNQELHNQYIDEFLTLHKTILDFITAPDLDIENHISQITDQRARATRYFEDLMTQKGKFGVESYYKFLLYNRTSMPFLKTFNEISNIEVVKIPLRGRDLSVFKLGIQIIDEAIENPDKYIDEGTLCGKYFHYDDNHNTVK